MAQGITETTRDRLLNIAGEVFGEKGYQAATIRDICQLAEANLAAVNYHFGDKERLYSEAVKKACLKRADQVPLPQWTPETPAADRLRDFIHTIAARMLGDDSPQWHTQLMMREMSHPTAACGELVREHIRPQFELLQAILRELLPQGTSAEDCRLTAFSIIGQCLYHRLARPVIEALVGPEELASHTAERLTEHITWFSLAALRGQRK